jgi:arsenate reductase
MYQVYGIKNCNTVKKGLDWLDHNQIEYEFLDVKKNVLDKNLLNTWMKNLPANLRWDQQSRYHLASTFRGRQIKR